MYDLILVLARSCKRYRLRAFFGTGPFPKVWKIRKIIEHLWKTVLNEFHDERYCQEFVEIAAASYK